MIMACLKYGQYFSQYDVRDIAVVYPEDQKQSGGHWWVEFKDIFYITIFDYINLLFPISRRIISRPLRFDVISSR